MRRQRNETTEVILKNGKKVNRVIRVGEYGTYIIYNGRRRRVLYIAGDYFEVYE